MIERQVTVFAVQGDQVWVEAQRTSACSHCGASNACGTSVLSRWMQNKNRILLHNTLDWREGEQVIVGMDENELIKAAMRVYLLPIVAMLITALTSSYYTDSQGLIALSGLGGLLAGFFIMRRRAGGQCPVVPLRKAASHDLVTSIDIQEL